MLSALDDPNVPLVLAVTRRQLGKSTLVAASAISELFTQNSYVLYVCASQAQGNAVWSRKVRGPLEKLLAEIGMEGSAQFTAQSVTIPAFNSAMVVVSPNEATAPGRTVSLLCLDECRDIPDSVFTTLAPSVIGGQGRMVLAGTPGQRRGFFYELTTDPPDRALVVRPPASATNPYESKRAIQFLRTTLAKLWPAAARRELDSEFTDSDDEFLPSDVVARCVDSDLREYQTHDAPCYGFLDLSRTRDLSSLVVVASVAARVPEAADHLLTVSIQTWDPKRMPGQEIDFAVIREALLQLPKRFPNLRTVLVDQGAEFGSVSSFLKQHPEIRAKAFVGTASSNMAIWSALSGRLHSRTLTIPKHERLLDELRNLRREEFQFGSKFRIVDASKKYHRDVSLALAGAVHAAGRRSEPLRIFNSDDVPLPTQEENDAAWRERKASSAQHVLDEIKNNGVFWPDEGSGFDL